MAVNVETLDKLERKITLSLPLASIQSEVDARLKRLARTVKMDGFRPGKVPMSVVARQYGYSVQYEVLNDKVGQAFSEAANEAQLRVAGQRVLFVPLQRPSDSVKVFDIHSHFLHVTLACSQGQTFDFATCFYGLEHVHVVQI